MAATKPRRHTAGTKKTSEIFSSYIKRADPDSERDVALVSIAEHADRLNLNWGQAVADSSAVHDILNTLASIQALRPALAANPAPTSPQLARSLQATENVWRQIAEEFGMLTSGDVARLLGAAPTNRNYASGKRVAGQLLGALRGRAYLYPGFQFDRERGRVWPVIPELIKLSRANGWTDDDLILWLQGPTTSFEAEDRPVDHLQTDPEAVLAAATDTFEAEW